MWHGEGADEPFGVMLWRSRQITPISLLHAHVFIIPHFLWAWLSWAAPTQGLSGGCSEAVGQGCSLV